MLWVLTKQLPRNFQLLIIEILFILLSKSLTPLNFLKADFRKFYLVHSYFVSFSTLSEVYDGDSLRKW